MVQYLVFLAFHLCLCLIGLAKTRVDTETGPKMTLETAPRKKVLGAAKVYEKTGLSRRTVYRLLEAELFPKPFSLPDVRKRVWLESAIDQYIDEATKGAE